MKEQKINNESGDTTKGKWLSVKIEAEELETIEAIQAQFKKLGLVMSQSKIIRQFMAVGFRNTQIDDVLDYPIPFFTNHKEEGVQV